MQRGWPTSLARPGGNLTGVSTDAGFEIWNKRFQFLREAAAQLTRVSVLAPRGIWEGRYGPALRDLTRGTAVSLLEIPLEEPVTETAYGRFFEALAQAGADGLMVTDAPENLANRRLIANSAAAARLPTIYSHRECVEVGGLMAYAPDFKDLFRHAARQIDQILKGAKPADFPFYQIDQISSRSEPERREIARPDHPARPSRPCRRSDRMRRRDVTAFIGCAAAAPIASLTAWAQVPVKPHRIAFVVSTTPVAQITEADHSLFRVFLDELRKLGHTEGHNLIIERHSGEGRFDQFPDLARTVVQTNPEVIVAITERVAHAFKAATTTIPVVTIVSDPVAQGLARSFARPDGNITGVSGYAGLETIGKYLEILKEIVPHVSRIGLLAPGPRGS